jgi:hypothetical protein
VDNDLIPFRVEVAKRMAALNTAIGWPADAAIAAADRVRVRTQVAREFFIAEHGRQPVDARELAGQIAKDSRPRNQTMAGSRPATEPALVDPPRANINIRRSELAIQFQNDHGRPPTAVEGLHLAQQATLETRDAKHEPRFLTEQRATWLNEAAAVLGGRRAVVADGADSAHPAGRYRHHRRRAVDRTNRRSRLGRDVEECRSTWQMWHVRAEAQRQVRSANVPTERARALVDLLVDECWMVGLSPLSRHVTASTNRKRCGGSTGPRSIPWPVPTSTPRSGS